MIAAGNLKDFLRIERRMLTKDDHGEDVGTWETFVERRCAIVYGNGQERRAAAQESASQPATFTIRNDLTTRQIAPGDRLIAKGAEWDIRSVSFVGRDEDVAIEAVRAA